MKKILGIFLFLSVSLFAQQIPLDYNLGSVQLSKSLDQLPVSNTIEKILIQDNVVWLATSKGLSKSTDNGASWINYYGIKEFGEESISSLGYNNGTIWASTWHYENKLGGNVPVGTGLKYSTDQGQTWNIIPQPIDSKSDTVIIYGSNLIKTIPKYNEDENFVYGFAFTKNTIWIVSARGGLRKSIDNGKTWQRILLPPDDKDNIKPTDQLSFKLDPNKVANHITLSIYAIDDQTIFVGTQGGLNKSTDGGISWEKFTRSNQTKPISGNNVFTINKNQYDNSIWVATLQLDFPGVSVSYDNGQSWDNYLSGEKVRDFGFKYFGNPGAYTGADIFAASENGLFRSSNNGTTWIAAPEIKDDSSSVGINTKRFLSVEVNKRSDNSTDIWLGSENGLARLNETDGFWSGKWKVFLASEKLASTSETYAFPNPFSPDEERIRIKYSTSQPSNVTIRIFDFGMNLVRTVIQNAPRDARDEQIELWDGKDESGKIVPNGVYFYRIDISSSEPLFGKIMVLM